MEQRELGRSGISVTRIILGCGNFGGVGSAPAFFGQGIPREEAPRIMDAAWELGITTFDTADAYGGGRSETWIGEWLAIKGADVRDTIVIETKTFNPIGGGRRSRSVAPPHQAADRDEPATARPRTHPAVHGARVRRGDAAGGDALGVRRAGEGRKGRCHRCVQLHRRAARGGSRGLRARGARALRVGRRTPSRSSIATTPRPSSPSATSTGSGTRRSVLSPAAGSRAATGAARATRRARG